MKRYRIIQDCFSGFEAQVQYKWFPIMWFQLNNYYWVNTWESQALAESFIQCKKTGQSPQEASPLSGEDSEYQREAKLLLFKWKNFFPIVVWEDKKLLPREKEQLNSWPVFALINLLKFINFSRLIRANQKISPSDRRG